MSAELAVALALRTKTEPDVIVGLRYISKVSAQTPEWNKLVQFSLFLLGAHTKTGLANKLPGEHEILSCAFNLCHDLHQAPVKHSEESSVKIDHNLSSSNV